MVVSSIRLRPSAETLIASANHYAYAREVLYDFYIYIITSYRIDF
jgi:hypothetical protein